MFWSIAESRGIAISREDRDREVTQRRAELRVAQYFYQYCERAGLPLPPIADALIRDELLTGHDGVLAFSTSGVKQTPYGLNDAQWPPKEILPILGLAQHYGLPTRLLDWSFSPLVAGYFAAAGAIKRLENGGDGDSLCCVWSTTANSYELYGQVETLIQHGKVLFEVFPARLVQPPSAENPNLMLQRGVFTVVVSSRRSDGVAADRRELHETLVNFSRTATKVMPGQEPPLFFSLFLPIKESPRLLLRLSQLGYSANRIYHGYSGAADAVREHANLYRHLQNAAELTP